MDELTRPETCRGKQNIFGLTRCQLQQFFRDQGENPAKAELVLRALYRDGCRDLDELTQLSPRVRQLLSSSFELSLPRAEQRLENDSALKLLLRLDDGQCVESVLMKHGFGWALCLSTQVGCAMSCAFCASGRQGWARDLTAAELTGQLLLAQAEASSRGQSLHSLALMGMGEPLANLDNVLYFIDIATDVRGLDFGPRHISISSCGLPAGLARLARRERPNNLCLSLHAPTDELRSTLMPINRLHNIASLMQAARDYAQQTRQRVVIEYTLLDGVNDSEQCARQLADLLRREQLPCSVNLIPYNPGGEKDDQLFRPSPRGQVLRFYDILKQAGLNTTIRKEMGGNIKAACGQLRAENS